VNQSDAKNLLAYIAKQLPKLKNSESLDICKIVVDAIKLRINFFIEVDAMFKRAAGQIYDVQNNPYEAIKQL
jgi:hypothetical protein